MRDDRSETVATLTQPPERAYQRIDRLDGPGRLFQAAIPVMVNRGGGSIVLISSVVGLRGTAGEVAYGAAKTAPIGLMRSMAVDFGPHGVRVSALCPRWVTTSMIARRLACEYGSRAR